MSQAYHDDAVLRDANGGVAATLFSSEVGERSYTSRYGGNTWFSCALLEALHHQAVNDQGDICLSALSKYLTKRVSDMLAKQESSICSIPSAWDCPPWRRTTRHPPRPR